MSTVDDLAAFIAARLDEVEARARAAMAENLGTWRPVQLLASEAARIVDADGMLIGGTQLLAEAEHIAHHDPDRVLRDVTAKRAILDGWRLASEGVRDTGYLKTLWLYRAACAMAAAWSDHPGYRREWIP